MTNLYEDKHDRCLSYTDIWFNNLLRKVNRESRSNIARIISVYRSIKTDSLSDSMLMEKATSIRSSQQVTIQMSLQTIKDVIEKGEVSQIRSLIGENEILHRGRKLIEEELGIFSDGSKENPHVIYGALYSPQGENVYVTSAPSDRYGSCFMVLKTDEIRNRVIFCFGDSAFADARRRLLNWNDAAVGKALIELCGPINSVKSYIEAIIAGGVTLHDIEHIYVQQGDMGRRLWLSQSKEIMKLAEGNGISITVVVP